MKKFLATAWTFSTVLVEDTEIDGTDVVIGTINAENEQIAKETLAKDHKVPVESLTVYELV